VELDGRARSHLVRANDNFEYAWRVMMADEPTQADLLWATVAAFYSAVHVVGGYLWTDGGRAFLTHQARMRAMRDCAVLSMVIPEYSTLQDESEQARYHPEYIATPASLGYLIESPLREVRKVALTRLAHDGYSLPGFSEDFRRLVAERRRESRRGRVLWPWQRR